MVYWLLDDCLFKHIWSCLEWGQCFGRRKIKVVIGSLTDRGTYPQLPTQPKKIVQDQTNTVVFYGQTELSGEEKSKFEFEENGGLWLENSTNLHFQYYTELFFLEFKFWFFFARQLRVTIEDYCISLNPNNFFLVVLGVVGMCHDLLNKKRWLNLWYCFQFRAIF